MSFLNSRETKGHQLINLVGLTQEELSEVINSLGIPQNKSKMRTKQLWHWIYFQGVTDFTKMTTLGEPVSYTNLKLPTNYSVKNSEDAET